MFAKVLMKKNGTAVGVLMFDDSCTTYIDERNAVAEWLVQNLQATNIRFVFGTRLVKFTAGGGAPYESEIIISNVLPYVVYNGSIEN